MIANLIAWLNDFLALDDLVATVDEVIEVDSIVIIEVAVLIVHMSIMPTVLGRKVNEVREVHHAIPIHVGFQVYPSNNGGQTVLEIDIAVGIHINAPYCRILIHKVNILRRIQDESANRIVGNVLDICIRLSKSGQVVCHDHIHFTIIQIKTGARRPQVEVFGIRDRDKNIARTCIELP